jgi:hypothetical protein
MGPLGAGLQAKLARNLVQYASWLAAYEAQVLAEAAGIELAKLAQVIKASDARIGGASTLMFRRTVAPFTADDDAGLVEAMSTAATLAHKDLRAAMEMADALGVELPLAAMTDARADALFGIGPDPTGHPDRSSRWSREVSAAFGEERMLIDGRLVASSNGATYPTINPATEEVIGVCADATAEISTTPSPRPPRLRRDVVVHRRGLPGALPAPTAAGDDGARRRVAGHDHGRDRVATVLHPVGRPRRTGGVTRLGGRSGRGLPVDDRPGDGQAPGDAGTGGYVVSHRRGGGHHALERPPPDQPGQDRAGAGRREHGGAQAGARHPVVRHRAGSADRRGDRHPGRGRQHRDVVGTGLRGATGHRPRVDQVSFTGSTGHRAEGHGGAAGTLKKVFLELGGKSAFVVLDDADLRGACATAAFTVCTHAGQGCAITTGCSSPGAGSTRPSSRRPSHLASSRRRPHRPRHHLRSADQ